MHDYIYNYGLWVIAGAVVSLPFFAVILIITGITKVQDWLIARKASKTLSS